MKNCLIMSYFGRWSLNIRKGHWGEGFAMIFSLISLLMTLDWHHSTLSPTSKRHSSNVELVQKQTSPPPVTPSTSVSSAKCQNVQHTSATRSTILLSQKTKCFSSISSSIIIVTLQSTSARTNWLKWLVILKILAWLWLLLMLTLFSKSTSRSTKSSSTA